MLIGMELIMHFLYFCMELIDLPIIYIVAMYNYFMNYINSYTSHRCNNYESVEDNYEFDI